MRGFGDSEGTFTDYTLSDWIADARLVLNMLRDGPPITIVGNSFGGWIAWMMAQECSAVEKLILIAPAFDAIGVRAREISADRRKRWHDTGWMPWDDDPVHKDWPLSWKWVEESDAYWSRRFDRAAVALRQPCSTVSKTGRSCRAYELAVRRRNC